MTFRSDLGAILAPSWSPKWKQIRHKMMLKNDEKIMMTRIALRSHIGDPGGVRHLDFRARGGGKEEG